MGSLCRSDMVAGSKKQLVLGAVYIYIYCWHLNATMQIPWETRGKTMRCHRTEPMERDSYWKCCSCQKKTEATLTPHFGCLPPLLGATAVSHGQWCQTLKSCRIKRMDVSSLHCQNEVICQGHYSRFICALAYIQAVLGLLQLVRADSFKACKMCTSCHRQSIPSKVYILYLYFCEYLSARRES